jgi:hypothetical protein
MIGILVINSIIYLKISFNDHAIVKPTIAIAKPNSAICTNLQTTKGKKKKLKFYHEEQ